MIPDRLLNVLVLAALGLAALAAHLGGELYTVTLATRAAILALAATGLNLALGMGGLVSLGHAVFFGLGGYAMGIPAWHAQSYQPLEIGPLTLSGTTSMPLIWLIALAASGLAALLVGLLALRTAGAYFIMITLAFGQMFFFFAVSWPAYGGEDGLSIYVRNGFPGLDTLDPIQFFALCFALLAGATGLVAILRRAPFGLALNAARQSPDRARAAGIEPQRLRLVAFVLSGAITGLAGALFADLNRFVSPAMFSWQMSGEIMVLVILGGAGRLSGPTLGAALFVAMEHVLGGLSPYWHVFLGLLLLVVVLFARGGIAGVLTGRARG